MQVIVVPIFWNRKPDEKAQVIRAAEAAVKVLKAAGLTTGMDTTNAMSPGQKFAYWSAPENSLHSVVVALHVRTAALLQVL